MLFQALLQTSLVLWMAQQTLQGGVKPQGVGYGRMLPSRGVGIGVKPGAGPLGALGSRYGSKAMKTGMGRYPAVQPGVGGGYRSLGLGARANGYLPQGGNGGSLGTGMGLGTGLANGLGLGMGQGQGQGQGGKRGYGGGAGTLPGYGALAGIGYPGARPGMSAADMGGPEMAALGQAVQDLKRAKSRVFGSLFLGKQDRTQDNMRRGGILPTNPELQAGTGFRPAVQSPGPATFPDKQGKSLGLGVAPAQGQGIYPFGVPKRKGTPSHGATLAAGGVRQPQPGDEDIIRNQGIPRNYDPSVQQGQQTKNCGSTRHLSDELEKYRQLLASEAQRTQGSVSQPRSGEDSRHLGLAPQAQGEEAYRLSQSQDARTDIFSLPLGQKTGVYSSPTADRQGVEHLRLAGKDSGGLSGTVVAENLNHGAANPQVQRVESDVPVIPGESGTKSLGVATAGGQKEKKGPFNAEHDGREPKALSIPEQAGRNTQGTSFIGGAGPYPGGAGLGAGGYGPGLGQGAYLGGAAGKLGAAALGQGGYPHGAGGKSNGYGEGVTGYHGAGNGFGYGNGNGHANGNGYADPYGTGHGYPSELADVAENKAGKSKALGTGAYAGHPQGAYGGLGTGLDATAGKYGGGAGHAPYGGAPVIPTGLEGEVGYPYGAQQLSSVGEGAKTASKHGYGGQLGPAQEMLGEQVGKYGGYKG